MKTPHIKVYTRRGDRGLTRLLSGESVPKDDPRPKVYGAVDELQSHLGLARSLTVQTDVRGILYEIQQDLFVAGAELASSDEGLSRLGRRIGETDIAKLEHWIDDCTERCGLPGGFVIPGEAGDSAAVHVARAVCRRCERLVVMMSRDHRQYETLLAYFNRLGDLLFVLAWFLEFEAVVEEISARLIAAGRGEDAPA